MLDKAFYLLSGKSWLIQENLEVIRSAMKKRRPGVRSGVFEGCLRSGERSETFVTFSMHFVDHGHHEGGEHKREVNDDVPDELVVRHLLDFHEDAKEVNRRNGNDRSSDLVLK